MRKVIAVSALTGGLLLAGMGAAYAATSGTMNVSTGGAYTSGGTYDFKNINCRWSTYPAYEARAAGTYKITATGYHHINLKAEDSGYERIREGGGVGDLAYSGCAGSHAVTLHSSVTLQVCHEHWYGDDCNEVTKNR